MAVRWAADELGVAGVRVRLPDGAAADLHALDLWQLLNLRPEDALDAAQALESLAPEPRRAAAALAMHSLEGLGFQDFGRRLEQDFGSPLPPAVVLVPSTAHYSWEKICRSLGIGAAQLVHVPVDRRFRMDAGALWETLAALAARRQPVVGVVSVLGTTEESAVDRLDLVADARDRAARELGMGFWLHADAAWGGYAVSITRAEDGSRRAYGSALRDFAPEVWPDEGVYRALSAVDRADSVTIDPHKLGFIPYPAGAIAVRDGRGRELLAVEAPYLFHGGHSPAYIGRYIFEGSKPGAAAAAVWMSHKVLPLDRSGYGRLIGETARGALVLHRRLAGGNWDPFRVVPLPTPDLNIVCFAVGHPALETLEATNAFVDRVYRSMSVSDDRLARQIDYFVTKTVLQAREYGDAPEEIVRGLGFTMADYRRAGGVAVIRCTVMDPFMATQRGKVDFVEGFVRALGQVFQEQLASRA
ncbi:MAG TPA: pyridoxal-dependent decarboxylase [Longimicrobiaceae bacterium]|nr:pyridoxal-dependent decarboxylase [Longimicrobiaceae bacterium]